MQRFEAAFESKVLFDTLLPKKCLPAARQYAYWL
jgi:hypothetical protein